MLIDSSFPNRFKVPVIENANYFENKLLNKTKR